MPLGAAVEARGLTAGAAVDRGGVGEPTCRRPCGIAGAAEPPRRGWPVMR
jgi:hypothetical protein